jgi:hypothetical protein
MSWGVDIVIDHADGYATTVEVVSGHTYNLTPMWRKAGIFETSRDLDGRSAGMLAPILSAGLVDAVRHRSAYEELNPANGVSERTSGAGDVVRKPWWYGLVVWVDGWLRACVCPLVEKYADEPYEDGAVTDAGTIQE